MCNSILVYYVNKKSKQIFQKTLASDISTDAERPPNRNLLIVLVLKSASKQLVLRSDVGLPINQISVALLVVPVMERRLCTLFCAMFFAYLIK